MKNATLIISIIVVYIFAVFVNMPLVYDVFATGFLWFDGSPVPIFTADAGLHGFYAKSILNGVHYPFDAVHFLGYIVATIVAITTIPIDWVMLFISIFIAPLIVVPIILFAKSVGDLKIGVIASLIAVSFSDFYGRVALGYADTDMFTLLMPLIAVYYMMITLKKKKLLYAFLVGLTLLIFQNIYHSSTSITLLLLSSFAIYSFLNERKNNFVYFAFVIMSISILPITFFYALFLMILILLIGQYFNARISIPYYYLLTGILLILMTLPFILDLSRLYSRALAYLDKEDYYTVVGINGTYFFQHGLESVAEVTVLSISQVVQSFSVVTMFVVLSILGYALLLKTNKYYWLLVPFALLGSFSFFAGYRFSFFYTPVYAFGLSYLILSISSVLFRRFKVNRAAIYLTFLVLLVQILYILNINRGSYTRMLAYSEEKELLKKLSTNLSSEDKIISWWDLGWPLWYFTGYSNTLVDNGTHGGPDSYMMSKIITESNQTYVANAAKYFANHKDIASKDGFGYVTTYLASKYDLEKLFNSFYVRNDITPSQDTYIILHRNMITIMNAIVSFSDYDFTNIDHEVTDEFKFRFFPYKYPQVINQGFLERHSRMNIDGHSELVHNITFVKDQKIVDIYQFDVNSTHNIVFDNYETAYMTNQNVYNSFLFQALLMDNYDHNLFEKVGETYLIKIFKVK